MGKGMVAKKKKDRTAGKPVTLTKAQINKIKRDATKEAVDKVCLLAVAVMAENHNLTEDEICKDMMDISRWSIYLDKHILKINEVADIIEKKTGMKMVRF